MAKIWDGYHGSGSRVFLSRQGAADSRSCFLRDGRMQRKRRRLEGREREKEREGRIEGKKQRGWRQWPVEEGRRGCFYHSYRGPILEPRAFSPLRDLFRRGREREGRDRIVRGRERRRKKFGGETEEKELTLGEGDEGGLDGIRGMSCNNRAAIRASVPTRGGATARLGSARLGSLPPFRSSGSSRFPQLGFNLRNLTINGRSIFSLSLERCFSKIATFIAPLHISISSRSNFLTNLRR